MASVNGEAVHRAIRERINGTLSTPAVRAIPPNTYGTDLPEGLPVTSSALRGLFVPQFTVTPEWKLSEYTPPQPGNVKLADMTVTVRGYYNMTTPVEAERSYQASRAQLLTDADTIADALSWPGALLVTSDSIATGIISGQLRLISHRITQENPDGAGDLMISEMIFFGYVKTAPAIT